MRRGRILATPRDHQTTLSYLRDDLLDRLARQGFTPSFACGMSCGLRGERDHLSIPVSNPKGHSLDLTLYIDWTEGTYQVSAHDGSLGPAGFLQSEAHPLDTATWAEVAKTALATLRGTRSRYTAAELRQHQAEAQRLRDEALADWADRWGP